MLRVVFDMGNGPSGKCSELGASFTLLSSSFSFHVSSERTLCFLNRFRR
jgi:hypothetical protein